MTGRVKVETSILKMEAEKVSEALVSSSTLMQLIAPETISVHSFTAKASNLRYGNQLPQGIICLEV
jgi:hypothetical protein